MARKYVSKKAKKYRRRARKYYRKRSMLSFSKAPMPNKFATKLRYQSAVSVNPGAAGAAGVHVFSANGLYDTDITSTGHQPRGFDSFMAMYDHYTVIGAKIICNFVEGASYDNHVFIALKDSSTVYTDPNDYLEGRNVVSTVLPHSGTGQSSVRTLTKAFSTRKFLGRSKVMADSELKGSSTGNPNEQAFFHVGVAPLTSVDESGQNINVRIEFLVVFTEPKQPPQS